MHLKLTKLEERLLFDAAIAAALAPALVGDAGSGADAAEPASMDAQEALSPSLEQTPTDFYHVPDGDSPVQVLVISSDIDQAEQLAAYANKEVIVVQYDAQSESLSDLYNQVAEALDGRLAASIAFATHGQYGQFHLTGDYYVNSNILQESQGLQQFWQDMGSLIQEGGRLDLLGCYIGQDSALLNDLNELVGEAEIAASTDFTGNLYNGNWNLEVGDIDAALYFSTDLSLWQGSLAQFTVTNNTDAGPGSLRQAILDANGSPGFDQIIFNITANPVISIDSFLPAITEGVSINGINKIIVDGSKLTGASIGIQLNENSDGSIIEKLVIHNFKININLNGADNVIIRNNSIGTIADASNSQSIGIQLINNAENNSIENNLISGNNIGIQIINSSNTFIGKNVISGNTGHGIFLDNREGNSQILGTIIKNNIIGLDHQHSPLANEGHGIYISNAQDTTISDGNIIAENQRGGVVIDGLINGSGAPFVGSLAFGNQIISNSIFNNAETQIQLLNNGNFEQQAPEIVDVVFKDGFLTINGIMNGPDGVSENGKGPAIDGKAFIVQFFAINALGESLFIGQTLVKTNSPTPFTASFVASITNSATSISATATQVSSNNSSGFSIGASINFLGSPGDAVLGDISKLAQQDAYSMRIATYGSNVPQRSNLPWGFIGVYQKNQLTSWGDQIGYGHLSRMGDTIRSFFILDGEPHLNHTSRNTGYADSVEALNYSYEHFGLENKHDETQNRIRELSSHEEQLPLSA